MGTPRPREDFLEEVMPELHLSGKRSKRQRDYRRGSGTMSGAERTFLTRGRARAKAQKCEMVQCIQEVQVCKLVRARATRVEKLSRTRF